MTENTYLKGFDVEKRAIERLKYLDILWISMPLYTFDTGWTPTRSYSITISTVTPGETGSNGSEYTIDGVSCKRYLYNPIENPYSTATTTGNLQLAKDLITSGQCFQLQIAASTIEGIALILGSGVASYIQQHVADFRTKTVTTNIGIPSGEVSVEYTFTVRTWYSLPKSLETPILEGLMKLESATGWTFWTCSIIDDKIEVKATKNGSVTLIVIISAICAAIIAVSGLFIIRSYNVVAEQRILLQKELSEERQAVEETKQLVIQNPMLSAAEKTQIISGLQEYQNNLSTSETSTSQIGEFKDIMMLAIVGALAIGLLKR